MINKKGIFRIIHMYLRRNRVGEILVLRGKLAPHQLKEALETQQKDNIRLGHVLVQRGFIRRHELYAALISQSMLRTVLAAITILGGVSSVITKQAAASDLRDIPGSIFVASTSSLLEKNLNGTPADSGQAAIFGTTERSSTDLTAFTKWSAMFDRFSIEVSNKDSDDVVQKWRKDLAELRGLPLTEMASRVNDLMNKIRYISDNRNWGKSDYWETPVEFLTKGGDCEDFAIAKYVSLRALGVPDHVMRVAIVKDLQKGIPHAILIVYTKNGPMVLDNQIKRMVSTNNIHHYKPIFSINQTAWWLHTDRHNSDPAQIASASH